MESKPGLFPGRYQVEAAPRNSIAFLTVEHAQKKIDRFDGMPPLVSIELSEIVAESIVRDYNEAQLGIDAGGGPGLGYLPNEEFTSAEEIIKAHPKEIGHLRMRQLNWFKNLVKIADDEWSRYHRHRNISDLQRMAAVETGQTLKEWLTLDLVETMVECPMCLDKVPERAIMCKQCGTVQPGKEEQAKKFLIVRPPTPLANQGANK